jgi:hypothetical protein
MKIDLKKELKKDNYVTGEKTKLGLESFINSLKAGDILYDKRNYNFYRFENVVDFKEKFKKINLDTITKVDINKNKAWNFIKELKSGDYIKITKSENENNKYDECIIIKINKVEIENDTKININVTHRKFNELKKWDGGVIFYINGKTQNPTFKYDLNDNGKEPPLFDPMKINGVEYVYWIQNKSELEKQGATWDTFIDEHDKNKMVYKLEDLFTNKNYNNSDARLYDDLDLLNLITSFNNEYESRVFSRRRDYTKQHMILFLYSGDLNKPSKVLYSWIN